MVGVGGRANLGGTNALSPRRAADKHAAMSSTRRHSPPRTGAIALLTALILLIQSLAPAACAPAVAGGAGGGAVVLQLCTHDGVQSVLVPQDKAPPTPTSDCCGHCLTAIAAPPLAISLFAAPLRYEAAEQRVARAPAIPWFTARAPPRPPSQGPPQTV